MRAIHWQIPFESVSRQKYRVDIYDEGYTGEPVTLMGGDECFRTDEDSDQDIFLPVRSSTGHLTICVEDAAIISAIAPQGLTDRYVELLERVGGSTFVRWAGFIGVESYATPYDVTPFDFSFPLRSTLDVLKDMPMAYTLTDKKVLEAIYEIYKDVFQTTTANVLWSQTNAALLAHKIGTSGYTEKPDGSSLPYFGCNIKADEKDAPKVIDFLTDLLNFTGYQIYELGNRWMLTRGDVQQMSYFNNAASGKESVPALQGINHADDNSQRNVVGGYGSVKITAEAKVLTSIDKLELTGMGDGNILLGENGTDSYCLELVDDIPGYFTQHQYRYYPGAELSELAIHKEMFSSNSGGGTVTFCGCGVENMNASPHFVIVRGDLLGDVYACTFQTRQKVDPKAINRDIEIEFGTIGGSYERSDKPGGSNIGGFRLWRRCKVQWGNMSWDYDIDGVSFSDLGYEIPKITIHANEISPYAISDHIKVSFNFWTYGWQPNKGRYDVAYATLINGIEIRQTEPTIPNFTESAKQISGNKRRMENGMQFRMELSNNLPGEYEITNKYHTLASFSFGAAYGTQSYVTPFSSARAASGSTAECINLARLANWWSASFEELIINAVNDTYFYPCQRVTLDGKNYVIVSRSYNWSESEVKLQLQELHTASITPPSPNF